jgi:hypothetical protein
MANLEPKGKGDNSMPGKQRPFPCVGTGRCGTRAIWLKLYCLNPNLQKEPNELPPERRTKPAPALHPLEDEAGATSGAQERCPMRAFKEMNGEPKSRYHV